MAKRIQRRLPRHVRPQSYEHRTEIALYALRHTLQSANHLIHFLTEQLGTDWQNLDPILAAARSELKCANAWLENRDSRKR